MTKAELIAKLEEKGIEKGAWDAVMAVISEALIAGEEVELKGIGKLRVKTNSARTGRNPKTGETMQIAESKGVGFKQSTTIKKALNG